MKLATLAVFCGLAACRHQQPGDEDDSGCSGALRDFWPDSDGDGWGAIEAATSSCAQPQGYVGNTDDCNDGDALVYPGATDTCNGKDDDCNGILDPDMVTFYRDQDDDGYGDPFDTTDSCSPVSGFVSLAGDCDDFSGDTHPDAIELCNGEDDDCDGSDDEDFDVDGDGYRTPTCLGGTDCDDGISSVHPGAPEICNDGQDNDCLGDGDGDCRFAGNYDLGDASAKAYSADANFAAGHRVETGDVTGDGLPDIIVGSYFANGYDGGAWVIPSPLTGVLDLASAGTFIQGESAQNEGGRAIGVADANGDGYEDVLAGAPDSPGIDAVIVLGPIETNLTFSEADFKATCPDNNECGHGLDLGDVTGDGIADACIAAGEQDDGGANSGTVFIVYGPITGEEMALQTEFDAELVGAYANLETGRYVRAGGDMDGDGVGEVMATATYDSTGGTNAGAVYVQRGPPSGSIDLSEADSILVGESPNDMAGEGIAMGDINGDGLDDAVVGTPTHDHSRGATYVVFGPGDGTIDLGAAEVIVRGAVNNQRSGTTLAASYAELLIGAPGDAAGGMGAGAAVLFLGIASGTYDTTDATAIFIGEDNNDGAGEGVALGDLTGDGLNEVLVGAPGEATGGTYGGAVYVYASE